MHGDKGSSSSFNVYDRSVQVLCSRRAEHTYEVTIASQPERNELNYPSSVVDIWPETEETTWPPSIMDTWTDTQENSFSSGDELCWPPKSIQSLEEPSVDLSPQLQTPLGLPYFEEAIKSTEEKPRHAPARTSFYFDPLRCQYRTSKQEKCFCGDTLWSPSKPIKTVRQKLIEFVQTEELDEYSFLALMTLLLAHMFRLTKAIFAMGSSAHIIVSIFICVWRFMVIKVEDILRTTSWSQVGLKCATLTLQLFVIFVCVFLFFWTILIPVYHLFVSILSKILYLVL